MNKNYKHKLGDRKPNILHRRSVQSLSEMKAELFTYYEKESFEASRILGNRSL